MPKSSWAPRPRRARILHGRERDLDRLLRLLGRGAPRVVAIIGMMGVGKTRLLDEARLRLGSPDDVAFVDDAASSAAVEGASAARVVYAATRALGLPREQLVTLRPLGADASPGGRASAVALLADGAGLDEGAMGAAEREALEELAGAADGLPSVLEQLAGWLTLSSARDLRAHMRSARLPLVPPALAARLARAWRSLPSGPREVLAAIAVADTGFDLRTARALVRPQRRADLPQALARLVDGGWLAVIGTPAEPRFLLPRPLRDSLRRGAAGGPRRRLTAHMARVAEPVLEAVVVDRAKTRSISMHATEIVRAWEDAHDRGAREQWPLAAALAALASAGDPDAASHARRIRASLEAGPSTSVRARLSIAEGDARWFAGQPVRADRCYRAAIVGARACARKELEALGWIRRATLGPELRRLTLAREHLRRGRRLAARTPDLRLDALAHGIGGYLARASDAPEEALAAFDRQAEAAAQAGDVHLTALAHASAADCHHLLGQHTLARARHARALAGMKHVDPGWARIIEGYAGMGAWEVALLAEAASHLARALAASLGARFEIVFAAAHAGVCAELGERARARASLARAETLLRQGGLSSFADHVEAAASLVTHAEGAEAASAEALQARMRSYLGRASLRSDEDTRAFTAAVRRATGADSRPRARLAPDTYRDHPKLVQVVAALEEARGEPLGPDEIFARVWPGETRTPRVTARARVRKAVSLLRALGLRGILRTDRGRYVLHA